MAAMAGLASKGIEIAHIAPSRRDFFITGSSVKNPANVGSPDALKVVPVANLIVIASLYRQ
jgi:hypothetical protein